MQTQGRESNSKPRAETYALPVTVHLRQIVIDAENARGLATFYQALVGGEYRPGDAPPADGSDDHAEWVTFSTAGGMDLTFQQVAELPRVTWPSGPRGQQMHLDFTVADAQELERQRAWAVASGATMLDDQSTDLHKPLYVFADPEGHPFCIYVTGTPADLAA